MLGSGLIGYGSNEQSEIIIPKIEQVASFDASRVTQSLVADMNDGKQD